MLFHIFDEQEKQMLLLSSVRLFRCAHTHTNNSDKNRIDEKQAQWIIIVSSVWVNEFATIQSEKIICVNDCTVCCCFTWNLFFCKFRNRNSAFVIALSVLTIVSSAHRQHTIYYTIELFCDKRNYIKFAENLVYGNWALYERRNLLFADILWIIFWCFSLDYCRLASFCRIRRHCQTRFCHC